MPSGIKYSFQHPVISAGGLLRFWTIPLDTICGPHIPSDSSFRPSFSSFSLVSITARIDFLNRSTPSTFARITDACLEIPSCLEVFDPYQPESRRDSIVMH